MSCFEFEHKMSPFAATAEPFEPFSSSRYVVFFAEAQQYGGLGPMHADTQQQQTETTCGLSEASLTLSYTM